MPKTKEELEKKVEQIKKDLSKTKKDINVLSKFLIELNIAENTKKDDSELKKIEAMIDNQTV